MTSDQLLRTLGDGVEHRLKIRRRRSNHLQHVGGSGLPRQRLFGLVEQPYVLDRNDSLVSEGLEQLNVMVSKRARLDARNGDRANRPGIRLERDHQPAAKACGSRDVPEAAVVDVSLGFDIANLRNLAAQHHFVLRKTSDRNREGRTERCVYLVAEV